MLTDAVLESFRRNGIAKSNLRIDINVVNALRGELQRVVEAPALKDRSGDVPLQFGSPDIEKICVVGQTFSWKVSNIRHLSDSFLRCALNTIIAAEGAQLLQSDSLYVWKDQVIYKPAVIGSCTGWHQDSHYWRVLSDRNQVTAWIALDDATVESGCLQVVRGSHKWGFRTRTLQRAKQLGHLPAQCAHVPIAVDDICMRTGEVHFHHGLMWHAARANVSDHPRRAFAIHFVRGDTLVNGPDASRAHRPRRQSVAEHGGFVCVWPPSHRLTATPEPKLR